MRLYLRVLVHVSGSSRSGPSGVVHLLLPSICLLLKRRTRLKTGWRHESTSLNLKLISNKMNSDSDSGCWDMNFIKQPTPSPSPVLFLLFFLFMYWCFAESKLYFS